MQEIAQTASVYFVCVKFKARLILQKDAICESIKLEEIPAIFSLFISVWCEGFEWVS